MSAFRDPGIQRPVLGRIQLPANYEIAVLALFPPLGGEILKKHVPYGTVRYVMTLRVTMRWQLIVLGP
jgi:hypothetical protein